MRRKAQNRKDASTADVIILPEDETRQWSAPQAESTRATGVVEPPAEVPANHLELLEEFLLADEGQVAAAHTTAAQDVSLVAVSAPKPVAAPPRVAGLAFADIALARAARQAALSVDGVSAVGTGLLNTVATYGQPGHAVRGVRIRRVGGHAEVEIHVAARMAPLAPLARQIRVMVSRAVSECVPCHVVDVFIDALDESL